MGRPGPAVAFLPRIRRMDAARARPDERLERSGLGHRAGAFRGAAPAALAAHLRADPDEQPRPVRHRSRLGRPVAAVPGDGQADGCGVAAVADGDPRGIDPDRRARRDGRRRRAGRRGPASWRPECDTGRVRRRRGLVPQAPSRGRAPGRHRRPASSRSQPDPARVQAASGLRVGQVHHTRRLRGSEPVLVAGRRIVARVPSLWRHRPAPRELRAQRAHAGLGRRGDGHRRQPRPGHLCPLGNLHGEQLHRRPARHRQRRYRRHGGPDHRFIALRRAAIAAGPGRPRAAQRPSRDAQRAGAAAGVRQPGRGGRSRP